MVEELLVEWQVNGRGAVWLERLPRGWCVDEAKVAALRSWRDRAAALMDQQELRWCVAVTASVMCAGALQFTVSKL